MKKVIISFILIVLLIFACQSKNRETTTKHIVPNNYNGVTVWLIKKGLPLAKRSNDTIFVEYNDIGYFESGDISVSFNDKTEHYYQNGEKITFIRDTTFGSFQSGRYYSNIITKIENFHMNIKHKQDSLIRTVINR